MRSRCYVNGCFLNSNSNTHAHYLLTKMILHDFISLRAFTVYMENSLQFEILLRANWSKWNLHGSKFHFSWTHVDANNEVTLHRSEILTRSEISIRFEFTSNLIYTCSYYLCWWLWTFYAPIPINKYIFKVNNRNRRRRRKICSKVSIKTREQLHWRHSGVFIVNLFHTLVLLLNR